MTGKFNKIIWIVVWSAINDYDWQIQLANVILIYANRAIKISLKSSK